MCAPDSLIFLLRQAVCLALLAPLTALAQGPDSMQDAANPDAPSAPLAHPAMKAAQPGIEAPGPNAWREAHDVVAAFPRGHADILAWEKQAAANPTLAPPSAPAASGSQPHSGHGAQPMQPQPPIPGMQGQPDQHKPMHMLGGKQ